MIIIFWTCAALVFYCYAVYPVLIAWLARVFGQPSAATLDDPDPWPQVTLLIAAHDEETVIEDRVRNALAMDYPHELFEIAIGLDGCSDGTAEIVRQFVDRGVRVLEYPERRGKAAVLNAAMDVIKGQIVLMSDANTDIDSQAAPPAGPMVRRRPGGRRCWAADLDRSADGPQR